MHSVPNNNSCPAYAGLFLALADAALQWAVQERESRTEAKKRVNSRGRAVALVIRPRKTNGVGFARRLTQP